jgi:hypothetical protein
LAPIKLIYKNGKIISIKVYYGNKDVHGRYPYNITFKDSYHLLPASLSKLATAFELPINKTPFPFDFVVDYTLNYIGEVPELEYYPEGSFDSIEAYNHYTSLFEDNWSLREEAIKYCINDCYLLLGVILKFQGLIFKYWKVDISKSPTLSSLSFKMFMKNFFDACHNLIPIFKYSDDLKIRKSYHGGTVGMIIPTNLFSSCRATVKLWLLDYNSLYPYIMANYPMPCGNVEHFVGDILELVTKGYKPIGFFKANITAPDNLKVPVLTTKTIIDGKSVNVAPTGAFTDWYFSEELYNARDNFGYKFEVLEGYVYSNRKILFSEYMNNLYKLRTSFDKSNVLNLISKFLLNSFYGRWGMTPYFSSTKILSDKEFNNLMSKGNINNLDILGALKYLNNPPLIGEYHYRRSR